MNPDAAPVLDPEVARRAAPAFHIMAKPSGAACNIDCKYCFFLSKEALYPGERQRMSEQTLEQYLRQLLESHRAPLVTVAWQGGEPTLMGLDFFRKAFARIEALRRPDQRVEHTFQTNGVALDDEWCAFLREHKVLVGLSVDGPRDLHDTYRVTRSGEGSFDLVMKGWRLLRQHGVEFNVLCTVHAANQAHGRRVYRFFRDRLGARFIQFIPIIERATEHTIAIANRGWSLGPREKRLLYTQSGDVVTERTVSAQGWGQFLIDVFEDWVRRDVGQVFVQLFDVTLQAHLGRHMLCIHAPTCGQGLALEYNGDLYSCDHFVEPAHKLGNIHQRHMLELVSSEQQQRFGNTKRDSLTAQCRACEVRNLCHGGCPKDRFARSELGEPGHNMLCAGLYRFFTHTQPAMHEMRRRLERQQAPAAVMAWAAGQDKERGAQAPCPCGSANSFRACHGSPAPRS
jgi:uncharacterized protein